MRKNKSFSVPQFNLNENKLVRRYLVWCYKTTKESLDRIDRYYTQLQIDQFLLDELMNNRSFNSDEGYKKHVKDFEAYMFKKKDNVDQKKYKDMSQNVLQPEYLYLQKRFAAIEVAIKNFLGPKELTRIAEGYEQEMTRRIWEAREHT